VAIGREFVSASVPKHMGMDLNLKPGLFSRALDHPIEAAGRERRPRSLTKTNDDF